MARSELTADHVKPLSKGGYEKRRNVRPACRACNQDKGDSMNYVGALERAARELVRPKRHGHD